MCATVVLDGARLCTLRDLDAVARLQVAASRAGCTLVVVNASEDLRRLVDLAGLRDVLDVRSCVDPCGSPRQSVRQAEQRKQAAVDEVRDADDSAL